MPTESNREKADNAIISRDAQKKSWFHFYDIS